MASFQKAADTGQQGGKDDEQREDGGRAGSGCRMESGAVFLDTADFLVLTPDTLTLLPELTNALRPATKVCVGLDVHADADLTKYLTAHPPDVTLGNLRSGKKNVPILQRREAGYRLESRDQ